MKRVLMLAFGVVAVLLCTAPAMAANEVVVPDQFFAVGQTAVEIPVKISNDVSIKGLAVPLMLRDVNPGGFPTSLALRWRDRLPRFGPLSEIVVNNQYDSLDATSCGVGFHTFVDTDTLAVPVTSSPWGMLMVRNKIFTPSLAPGTDPTGSIVLIVDIGASDGTFEVDTACVDPANHLVYIDDPGNPIAPSFTKGTITVGDGGGPTNTPPTAVCRDITVDANSNCQADVDASQVNNGSSDAESAPGELLYALVPAGPYPLGANNVQLIVTDPEGLADTCDAVITVEDNTPPTITCNFTLGDAFTGPGDCTFDLPDYTTFTGSYIFSDNCSGATVRQNPPAGTPVAPGLTNIYLVVEDGVGLKDSCMFQLAVIDNGIPSLSGCPNDTTVSCLADVPAPANVTADDNCPDVSLDFVETDNTGGVPCGGTIERMWIASDNAGNADTCIQIITVRDTEAPVLAGCPSNISVQEDSPGGGAVVNFATPTATDNCDADPAITQIEGDPSGSTFPVGVHTISFEAQDQCGNTDTCSFTIEVTAGTPPVVAACKDVVVDADANCEADVVAADVDNGSSGYTTLTLVPAGPYPLGETIVELIAANDQGDTSTCTATITVEDNTPPTLVCPDTVFANNNPDQCSVTYNVGGLDFSEADNCSAVSITFANDIGNNGQIQYPVGCTDQWVYATDEAGNVDSCMFVVCVRDAQAPVITCPGDIEVFEDVQGGGTAVVNYSVTTSDNCPGETLNQLAGLSSGSAFPLGTTVNTFEVVDASGNADTCSFNVTVNPLSDSLVARCKDVTVDADANCEGVVTPAMVDNGSTGQNITLSLEPAGPYPLGQTQVMLIVSEPTGAADTCDALITVNDVTPPTITCNHDNDTVAANENCEYPLPILTENGFFSVEDNCTESGFFSLSQNPVAGTPLGLGDHTVYIIAEDESGNKDSCSFVITVEDQTPPQTFCVDTLHLFNDPGACEATASPTIEASDNCGLDLVEIVPDQIVWPVGVTNVWAYAYDESGNVDSCSFVVEVADTQNPSITCPADISLNVPCGDSGAVVNFTINFEDNCPGATLECVPASGSFFPLGTTDVLCTVTDAAGNTAECSFKVTVFELSDPNLVVTPDTLFFYAIQNDTNPDPQQVTVENSGCGAELYWYLFENIDWADASPDTGTTDSFFDVFVDITGLAPGTYTDKIFVNADIIPGAKSGQFQDSVCVILEVESICDQSHVQVEPDTITVFYNPCADDTKDYANQYCEWIYIDSDIPGCTDGWTAYWDDSTFLGPNSLDPDYGVTPDSALLCLNLGGLEPGEYFECIQFYRTIVSAGSKILADDELCIRVIVEECCEPILGLDSAYYEFNATVGEPAPPCQYLEIFNVSPDCPDFPFEIRSNSTWLSHTTSSGFTPSVDTLCVDHSGLEPGCYWDTVRVTAPAIGSPGFVLVKLCVEPAPVKPEASIWVDENCGQLGDTVAVDVNFCNNFPASGISLGLTYNNASISAIGGDFAGSRVESINGSTGIFVDDIAGEICISAVVFDTVLIDTGCGKLATLYFVVTSDAECPNTVVIDSTTIVPKGVDGCTALLTDANQEPVWPSFDAGSLCIQCADECEICGYVAGVNGAPLMGATVEIWSSYPDGQIVDFTPTDTNGNFCFDLAIEEGYSIRVTMDGFCPYTADVQCGDSLEIVLEELPTIPVQPYGADWYSQNATIEGTPIIPGDVIIAMDPDGVICGVTTVETAGTYLIHVIGDDPNTVADEGAEDGDEITLYYNCECPLPAPQPWTAFANNLFDAAFDCSRRTIEIPLCESWTLISFNVLPSSPLVEDVLQSIDGEYRFLYSATCADGNISWANDRPDALNDLTAMDPCHGYWVLPTGPNVGPIVIEGAPVPVDKPLNLCIGWNAISYLPEEWDERSHALQSIDGYYDYLFTAECDGIQSWSADRPAELNDLVCMKPTKGYWIHMTESATQTYPTSGYTCSEVDGNLAKAVNISTRVTVTNRFSDFWSAADMSETGLRPGDVITAKTETGLLVGEALVNDKGWFLLHVYGDDQTTSRIDGAVPGEELTFEVNGVAARVSGNINWTEQESNEVTVFAAGGSPVPTDYALLQNYPNPFNPSTTIQFRLPEASEVNLTIYNVLGQQVRSLVAGVKEAGTHTVEWDGRDDNGSTVQSGMYFYRIQTPSFTEARKMTLLK
ncbi:MAG: hypothetical protein Kow0074_09310 [Candidatus Zixiibacteriota bacterium]